MENEKQLEEEAEKLALDKQNDTASKYYLILESYQAGATGKYVEKQKLEFAKTQLEKFRSKLSGYDTLSGLLKQELEIQIQELEQKLNAL